MTDPVEQRANHEKWHAHPPEAVLSSLQSRHSGLTSEEARQRLEVHGPNALPAAVGRHPVFRFLAQFNSTLIYFLLAAAVAAWILGHIIDASVIVAVVLVNAIVGFAQEGKAEKALQAMRKLISTKAQVLRDEQRRIIDAAELTPGDIVFLDAGDRVPADLRLLRARGLLVDEALLTGESVAAEKSEHPAPHDAVLGDRHSMAFSGTLVASGQGSGVVVATGTRTQIGRISSLLENVEQINTPLLRQINQFGRLFTWTAIAGAVLLFAFAVLVRDYAWPDALIAVVALAVGVVPEGLPAVITITLAIGVQRMAGRNAVIRRLPAVETLGATSVICSDKTGTLTRNEMTVRRIITAQHEFTVTGPGYIPEGSFHHAAGQQDEVAHIPALTRLLECALLCNDAHLRRKDDYWIVDGDPMEGALIAVAMKAGLRVADCRRRLPRRDEIPFDARYRFMASLHRETADQSLVFIKGAPEQVLKMAATQAVDGGEQLLDSAYWNAGIAAAASQGERVLGFACKRLPASVERLSFDDLADGVVFLGLTGFIDPPRDEAISAIAECRRAGIAVKMITGDHATTATAIAAQLGLPHEDGTVTGAEMDALSDAELTALIQRTAVFARTSPEHKLRIVRALQANGAVVAMTGDGVNDAPALKQADVGVAMGVKGTEAAKEAAEMVLLDDNFASIVNAVHEGRTVYDNIRKVISWTLPTNGGEVLTVIVAMLVGFTLPMSAAQILWINLILTVTLGLVLAFEPSEPNVMQRAPRPVDAPLLSPFLLWRFILVSTLFLIMSLGMFFYSLGRGDEVATARTLVVNTLVVLEIFYLFNVRYLYTTSMTLRAALGTPAVLLAIAAVVAAQLMFTYAPFMHELFDSRPLAFTDGALIVVLGIALLLLLEGEKMLMRRLGIFAELKFISPTKPARRT